MAKEVTYKPKTNQALKTFFTIGNTSNILIEKANEYIKKTGLSPTQFSIIDVLGHNGSLKISEIYSKILIKSGNKTMILDSLENKGMIKRVYSKNDRREIIIELTSAGQKFFDKNHKGYSEFIEDSVSNLSQSEQKEVVALLTKIIG
jgi:MarR family 2-MHQ and catechol resistance regulon transcriptional repressor